MTTQAQYDTFDQRMADIHHDPAIVLDIIYEYFERHPDECLAVIDQATKDNRE